jgi:two-component system NtrC family sensor kinase
LWVPMGMNYSTQINKNASFLKLTKGSHALYRQILHLANQGLLRHHFQQEVSTMIRDFTACDAVELWLKGHNKYFRCTAKRQSKATSIFEITPFAQNRKGEIIPGPDDDPDLFRLCRDIIRDQADLTQPGFKKSGSYWLGPIKETLPLLKRDKKSSLHGLNARGMYQSIALIPLRVDKQNIGLLQLKSKRNNYFPVDEKEFYENLAQTLAIALAHRDAQVDLRERVKELTCLYGIARLVAQPYKSTKKILQGIVKLLPHAWLYPNITFARILLDGHSYSTPGFQEGRYKQAADIFVSGEHRGVVEVVYVEESPELDEGPFLKEERNLIDAVAREVGTIIKRRETEDDQLRLREQLTRSEKMAALGQLSAGIAHEIRTPLTSIKIFIQSLERELNLDVNQKEDFRIIKKEIDRINENIIRFLNFARPEDPVFQQVDIGTLVKETLNLLAAKIKNSGLHLDVSLPENSPQVGGDPKQLGQVFLNLILNAIEAMPKGGTLTVRSNVKVMPDTHEKYLQLFIQDTGCGISEKDRPYLFDPFFTTKEGGTGLGLSIVYSIIQKHNGQIDVESEMGKGSSFIISLPTHKEGRWKESSSSMTT